MIERRNFRCEKCGGEVVIHFFIDIGKTIYFYFCRVCKHMAIFEPKDL
jgi:transcription elongation factor Elf1